MCGISSPLAATSVATMMRYFWLRNALITRSRLLCLKPPWITSALWSWRINLSLISSAPLCVLTKINTDPSLASRAFSSSGYLSFVCISFCTIFFATVLTSPEDMRTGLLKYLSDSFVIAFGNVAENKSVCLSFGI